MPCHSFTGSPEGIWRTEEDGVLVGGTGVFVEVLVGSGVLVEVGKLVCVGVDVGVGSGARELQDANVITRMDRKVVLEMVFIISLVLYSSKNRLSVILPVQSIGVF